MKRREFEALLVTLESTAAVLSRAAAALSPAEARRRPAAGGFSLVENVWHLADLEREGYGLRIRRILSESNPALLNFDGDRMARERSYQERDVDRGIVLFARARGQNLEALRQALARRLEALGLAGGGGVRQPRRHLADDGGARSLPRYGDRESDRRDPGRRRRGAPFSLGCRLKRLAPEAP